MKHRKRAAARIIPAALALGLLAGCGAAKTPGKPGATPGTAAEGSGSVWRAEKRKIDGLEGNMDAKAAAGDKLYFSTAPGYDAEGGEHRLRPALVRAAGGGHGGEALRL